MKISSFQNPYLPNGRTAFLDSKRKAGVYLIHENGVLVYVGRAGNCLYRTFYRHFQGWTDKNYRGDKVAPPSYRVTYKPKMGDNVYTARLIYCSDKQAIRLERSLIIKYNPRDNMIKYQNYQPVAWDNRVVNAYSKNVLVPDTGEPAPF